MGGVVFGSNGFLRWLLGIDMAEVKEALRGQFRHSDAVEWVLRTLDHHNHLLVRLRDPRLDVRTSSKLMAGN